MRVLVACKCSGVARDAVLCSTRRNSNQHKRKDTKMGKRTGVRRDEWNRPNKTALARLNIRIKDFEAQEAKSGGRKGYIRPGSMKGIR